VKRKDQNVVAMMDLLGFRDIMARESLDAIEKRYRLALSGSLALAGIASTGAVVFDESGNLDLGADLWNVSFGIFSDTVVLYPKRFAETPLISICTAVALLIDVGLQAGWSFRGGIDFGSFRSLSDLEVYLGTALVSAHELEASQDWVGCIVGAAALTRFPEESAALLKSGLLVSYPVPLKGRANSGLSTAVNWTYFDAGWNDDRKSKLRTALEEAPQGAKHKLVAALTFCQAMEAAGKAAASKISVRGFGDPTSAA
jgi:hypothetical protein